MKRILSVVLALSLAFTLLVLPTASADDSVITLEPKKSIEDINTKWAKLKPTFNGNLYTEDAFVYGWDPDSFKAGQVADGAKKDALNLLNFARYLADVPSDVVAYKDYETYAQYGSALLLCEGKMNHYPKQPEFMPKNFYETGYKGTSNGNLFANPVELNTNEIITNSVYGYLQDGGSSNITSVGHRRWALNPTMKVTGFGAARDTWEGKAFSVMYIGDRSRTGGKYDCVTWPAVGYHPTKLFNDNQAWSISLNKSTFDASKTKNIKVKMHIDLASGAAKDIELSSSNKDKSGDYFTVSTETIGTGFCVIFRPTWSYHSGDRVNVEISGVYKKGADSPTTIKYEVEFFRLGSNKDASSPTASNETKIASDKNTISDAVKAMKVTNATTKEQFLAEAMKDVKYGTTGEWGVDYAKTDATEQKEGLIKGTINLELDGVYQAVKVNKVIEKLGSTQSAEQPKATDKPKATEKPKTTSKTTKSKFKDVAADAYYADAVTWAVDNGITTGVSSTKFAPDDTCNRAQILTFLHRAVGAPEMEGGSPFTDVLDGGDYYYYDSALWAYYKGMVTDDEFAAETPCTRASTVMYLWQNAGSPDVNASTNFTDVPSNAYYAKAVAWAVQNGVTSGTSETEFSPDDICSRGQIVTFLNRALK